MVLNQKGHKMSQKGHNLKTVTLINVPKKDIL